MIDIGIIFQCVKNLCTQCIYRIYISYQESIGLRLDSETNHSFTGAKGVAPFP